MTLGDEQAQCRTEAKSPDVDRPLGDIALMKFGLVAGTTIETLPDGALLFCEPNQEIHRLNASSALLAFRLDAEATANQLADVLCDAGLVRPVALEWVMAFLTGAAREGFLTASGPPAVAHFTQRICVCGLGLTLHYSSPSLLRLLGSAYTHLESADVVMRGGYRISEASEFILIANDDGPSLVVERSHAAIRLKGMILTDVLGSGDHLAALHAACLVKEGQASLLLGSPGAGKTILALALMKRGYRYGSDDVTLVRPGAFVEGVALAPAVKEAAWGIIESSGGTLSEPPGHLRPDGKKVRFASLKEADLASPCAVAVIVRLRRMAGRVATLEPIPAADALTELFREARSPDGQCSTQVMGALAGIVRHARCFDLVYSEASDAAALPAAQTSDG